MKISSTKEKLVEGLLVVQASSPTRTTLPILHNFVLTAADGKIKTTRTDLELVATHVLAAEIIDPGGAAIPAKEFSEILHSLPAGGEVEVFCDETSKVHIKSGGSKFWVMGAPKEEYPAVPEMDKSGAFELPVQALLQMIQKTIFSASTQETRYVLNGILWISGKDGLEMVATDGRRLAFVQHRGAKIPKEFKAIVPTKVLFEVMRFLGTVKPDVNIKAVISVSPNQIGFQFGQTTFVSRLIEGNFPNYEQVIPAKKDVQFDADTKALLAVTRRAALCVGERGGAMKFTLKDKTLFINSASSRMEFNEELAVNYKGQEFATSFNPQYVIDVLKNMTAERVIFGMTTPANPVVMEPVGEPGCKYVIMPIRL
ncbi:MAG: DNA polymerase III subunit beta [Elusimicrobia bacterium]|nr:DNA polymerase III subunit beta [Elusimicrobiota bacterium]